MRYPLITGYYTSYASSGWVKFDVVCPVPGVKRLHIQWNKPSRNVYEALVDALLVLMSHSISFIPFISSVVSPLPLYENIIHVARCTGVQKAAAVGTDCCCTPQYCMYEYQSTVKRRQNDTRVPATLFYHTDRSYILRSNTIIKQKNE